MLKENNLDMDELPFCLKSCATELDKIIESL